jgi:hypothetical protein
MLFARSYLRFINSDVVYQHPWPAWAYLKGAATNFLPLVWFLPCLMGGFGYAMPQTAPNLQGDALYVSAVIATGFVAGCGLLFGYIFHLWRVMWPIFELMDESFKQQKRKVKKLEKEGKKQLQGGDQIV